MTAYGCFFEKNKGFSALKAGEALEEALCFGWIDGLMKKVDDKTYVKYFSPRRKTVNGLRKIRRRLKA